jgi:hypothetical protein
MAITGVFELSGGRLRNCQFSRIDSHPNHGIDTVLVQLVDFTLCGDASGRR